MTETELAILKDTLKKMLRLINILIQSNRQGLNVEQLGKYSELRKLRREIEGYLAN